MRLADAPKRAVRSQFGALPWRIRNGKVEILLITSRRTHRWILPKGWPMHGATPGEAAAKEAWEEAGVTGKVAEVPLGFYSYRKSHDEGEIPIIVAVFPLRVTDFHRKWPERGQRKRRWVSRKKAAKLLSEPDLRHLLRAFDPRRATARR
ncbi:MAG: NUDIX domain-containing protein [Alphaproteobacteria bacterium]|nr:MAG: NUDIX domain-containing protein [Alphaproteobacteria bacterium]